MQQLLQFVKNGWPFHRANIPPRQSTFGKIHAEIYEVNGLLFVSQKLTIPEKLRLDIL